MSAVTVPPYGCVTRALVENKSLTLGARLLYVELLCLPHEADGAVVETYAQLAQRLGVSESSVKRWIKALGGAGYSSGGRVAFAITGRSRTGIGYWRSCRRVGRYRGSRCQAARSASKPAWKNSLWPPSRRRSARTSAACSRQNPGTAPESARAAHAAARQTRTLMAAGNGFGSRGMVPRVRRGTASGGGPRDGASLVCELRGRAGPRRQRRAGLPAIAMPAVLGAGAG